MKTSLFLICLCLAISASAQGPKSDYERAFNFRTNNGSKVLNLKLDVTWATNTSHLWYRRELPGERFEYTYPDLADSMG